MEVLSGLTGSYEGNGKWVDITNDSKKYKIPEFKLSCEDNSVRLSFYHDLYEEDDEVRANFIFEFENKNHFKVFSDGEHGKHEVGSGNCFGNFCHYLLVIGEMVVENRMVFKEDKLYIFGSSSKNKFGHFIHWEEVLCRKS